MAGAGQTFDLFNLGLNTNEAPTGAFSSVLLPALGGGLGWDTSQLYRTGEISVRAVPEPSAIAFVSLSGLALLRRRRKA